MRQARLKLSGQLAIAILSGKARLNIDPLTTIRGSSFDPFSNTLTLLVESPNLKEVSEGSAAPYLTVKEYPGDPKYSIGNPCVEVS